MPFSFAALLFLAPVVVVVADAKAIVPPNHSASHIPQRQYQQVVDDGRVVCMSDLFAAVAVVLALVVEVERL